MKVDGKVWVVTGAGGGMGRELAVQLLSRGARVAAVDLSAEGLQGTASLAGSGERAKLMSLAIKLAPRRSIRFVKEQMAKREVGTRPVRN